ncbi:MAG: DUF2341 domain-containing protein, partial [Candidatus Daviesbacteria bacterium]|nr:DUF2341 domain-containing protein [Candidatus Daviesbacteria bacterium]
MDTLKKIRGNLLSIRGNQSWQEGFLRFTKKTLVSYLIASLILTGSGLLYLFNPFTKDVEAAWFDDSWTYRKVIEIATHTASENTVYINLTGVNDIDTDALTTDKLQADCGDLRFTKSNGELLPYYIVSGCDTTDTVVHVYFDTMPAGAQTIYYYYGNPSAPNGTVAADFSTEAANYTFGTAGSEEKGTSPTLYWKFDDGTIGTAEDTTTNGLDGTHNNTPTIQTENFCVSGKCLWFDGANNENVSRADDAKLDFVAADNFTVSAWVKRNGVSSANNFILTKAQSGYTGYKLYQDASGDYCFDVSDGTNTDTACTSAVEFDDDQWHFVQGVKAATTSITLYVDGKERAQDATIAATGTLANTGTLYVGVDLDGTSNEWLGFIDDVKVFRDNSARSAAQIQADFTARATGEGASAVLGQSDANENLSSGLVGYWKMDESSWTQNCTATSVTDSSGNGNNGKSCPSTTGPAGGAVGKFGNAGSLDGTNDYVSVAHSSSLNPASQITLSTWVYQAADQNDKQIFEKGISADSTTGWRMRTVSGGAYAFQIPVTSFSHGMTSTSYSTSAWHHVVGTYDGTTMKLYVDGVLDSELARSGAINSNSGSLTIGAWNSGSTAWFNGKLDDMRIYNRALSAGEVSQLYNFAPGPVGYWNLDEKTGTSAFDKSGNANTGTLTNTPTWTTGKYGAGINFAGSDQHVTRADDADFDFADDADFTFSAWVRHAATSTSEIVLSKFNEEGYKIIMESDGDFTCALDYDSTWTPTDSATSTAATYDDNNWHYISCVKTGASTLRLYIDGVLITTDSSLTASNAVANSDPLYIGIDADGTSNDWIGQIDEPKIYNYARSAKQVVEDMNAGHPAGGSPVGSYVAYWKMDEGYGTTANDSTSNANNLTLSSASWT